VHRRGRDEPGEGGEGDGGGDVGEGGGAQGGGEPALEVGGEVDERGGEGGDGADVRVVDEACGRCERVYEASVRTN
jgi:hypothetical protein